MGAHRRVVAVLLTAVVASLGWCAAASAQAEGWTPYDRPAEHAVVTDRDVIESVANGARCVNDVARQTGAGRICGGCISTVRELVCQACSITVERGQEVARAAR